MKKQSIIRNFLSKTTSFLLVTCSYTNAGLCGVDLTNSGTVCREEFGFVENEEHEDNAINEYGEVIEYVPLRTRSWSSIKRLNNLLITIQQ